VRLISTGWILQALMSNV